MAQITCTFRALLQAVMNLLAPKPADNIWTS